MISSAPFVKIMSGDVLECLRELPDESVHCCITSPPYWGLRDYSRCGCAVEYGGAASDYDSGHGEMGGQMSPDKRNTKQPDPSCPICHGTGKIAGTERQLGLEPTPEQYIANLVQVFHEVKRILRKDGTCWVNMGDCYASGSREGISRDRDELPDPPAGWSTRDCTTHPQTAVSGLKPKDLVGQPWRLAFALQADGWWLRSDIIWSKPNPMPESVTDRPTKAHEYIFLLSKSKSYFYDQEAVREKNQDTYNGKRGNTLGRIKMQSAMRDFSDDETMERYSSSGRNSRTVWEIATQPYPEAHFATFPEELPRRCIKAGTSEKGCCPKCGSHWERIVDISRTFESGSAKAGSIPMGKRPEGYQGGGETMDIRMGPVVHSKTLGWQPTCSCGLTETVPCVVLDPFAGSGTTGAVARSMGRSSILIELNPEYVKLIRERCETSHVALETFEEAIDES